MLYSQLVILLLLTPLAEPTSLLSSQSGNSAGVFPNITMADIFNGFLYSFGHGSNFMDVFVNTECLKDNTAQFKDFLKSRTEPVTLWTDGKTQLVTFDKDARHLFRQMSVYSVHILCGNFVYFDVWTSSLNDYFTTAFVIMDNARYNPVEEGVFLKVPFRPPYPRASGRYVLSVVNASVFLNSEFERNVIIHPNLTTELWLKKPRPLSGTCMHLTCLNSYVCEHPSFDFTVELLAYRNASPCADRITSETVLHLSSFVGNIESRGERDIYFRLGFYKYGSAGFSFYVPKRDRVPREKIFLLPFSGEVWIGLFVSSLVLLLTYGIISKIIQNPKADPSAFILPMVAASLQQSVKLHSSLLSTQPTRVLYGIMALIFVVMSTAFKGRLTSLLNDLPLQGKVTEFISFEDIAGKGHRLCILEDLGLITSQTYEFITSGTIKHGYQCFQTSNPAVRNSRSIRISADGKDTFFTYKSPTGPSEALRRELLGRGYVETRETVFSYAVGPEMRASSVYRHEFGVTVTRAIQAGLYVRKAQLTEYKSRSESNAYSSYSSQKLVLNLSDLQPFFLAWFVGASLSILAFVGEALLPRMGCRICTKHLVVILKHAWRKRRPRAGVM